MNNCSGLKRVLYHEFFLLILPFAIWLEMRPAQQKEYCIRRFWFFCKLTKGLLYEVQHAYCPGRVHISSVGSANLVQCQCGRLRDYIFPLSRYIIEDGGTVSLQTSLSCCRSTAHWRGWIGHTEVSRATRPSNGKSFAHHALRPCYSTVLH